MNVPIPVPTPEQMAASIALENSRRQYRLQDRATLLFMHQPDVVQAAREGDPTLADPAPTLAPAVTKDLTNVFNAAMNPNAAKAATPATPGTTAPAPDATASTAGTPAQPAAAAPLAFQDVSSAPVAGASGSSAVTSVQGATTAPPASGGNTVGVEILGSNPNVKPNDNNGGLKAVGPENSTALPAAEKPAEIPTQVNDIAPGTQPAAQAPNANGKNSKPEFDKADESSSKHKKKKGLSKLNPF
jgi:outer membrane protein assembly factor BamD